jgi:hypothetical protein
MHGKEKHMIKECCISAKKVLPVARNLFFNKFAIHTRAPSTTGNPFALQKHSKQSRWLQLAS